MELSIEMLTVQGYLLNIPGWDWRRDDQAVCLNEIKYGMLAQSVLAHGFFTLASKGRGKKKIKKKTSESLWGAFLDVPSQACARPIALFKNQLNMIEFLLYTFLNNDFHDWSDSMHYPLHQCHY